ncbi:helix-turn-helix transcriptional regulator [Chitinimonas arctica]|uniref:Helix-turn-helix transcriptional regulator n=1 Tax=Chitinimonas arctica TaxID=2594795 RepID=A0A516SI87_9NEIS|nr:helix-turn-helix domain-containing protein [Chitinimonas arctica]QDQ27862.1 helix-turn-helix transcriptional regulator [Chitinimonas arctica]
MSQTAHLIATLKRLLKARGITYAMVGQHLRLSEASVKRQFSRQSFTLQTLEAICQLMDLELLELAQAAETSRLNVRQLSAAQEAELVTDPRRVLVAVCVLNHWTMAQIVATYQLSEAQCTSQLLQLDKLGLIRLLPENRVRLSVARDFTWLPDGPIQRFFRAGAQTDFMAAGFNQAGELLRFQHGMLSPAANARFRQKLQRLVQEFTELHEDCLSLPAEARYGTSLLLAMRPWEPAAFEALRRQPDVRVFPPDMH